MATVLVLIALVLGAVVFLRAGDRQQAEPPEEVNEYVSVHEAICQAHAAAQNGDSSAARELFYGRAHAGLHALADELTEMDRPLAADLLRAKNAVEGSFDSSAGGRLESQLDELLRVSQMALESVGAPYTLCTS